MAEQLQLEGVVAQVLELVSGESARGAWQRRSFVLDVQDGNFPFQVAFETWGERVSLLDSLKVGQQVVVSFNLRSREYEGRWYTSATAWRIELVETVPITGGAGGANMGGASYASSPLPGVNPSASGVSSVNEPQATMNTAGGGVSEGDSLSGDELPEGKPLSDDDLPF